MQNKHISEIGGVILLVLVCVALSTALYRANRILNAQYSLIEAQKEYIDAIETLSDVQEEIINNTTKRYDRINPNSTSIR